MRKIRGDETKVENKNRCAVTSVKGVIEYLNDSLNMKVKNLVLASQRQWITKSNTKRTLSYAATLRMNLFARRKYNTRIMILPK